jgi:hypothetical protein
MLTWRCTKCVTSRYGKCHNIRENEIGESYTILSKEKRDKERIRSIKGKRG